MKTAFVLLLALCAVGASDDLEKGRRRWRCRSPQAFESMMSEFVPRYNVSIPFAKLTYDGANRRSRTVEMVSTAGKNDYYDVIYFQRLKVAFIFNLKTKNCTRRKIDYPWKPMSIPEDAKYIGDAYLGTAGIPGGGMQVQTWVGNSTEQGGYAYSTTFTRRGCLPINFIMRGNKIGSVVANFYNIVLGISDPNVFRPPKECFKQGQVLPEDLEHIEEAIPNGAEEAPQTDLEKSLLDKIMEKRFDYY